MTTFFFVLLGLLSLTTLNRCASTTHDNQDETGTNALSVQRGRTAEISKPLLHLVRRVIPLEDFQLNFSGKPWERCGETRPDIVTSSYLRNHTLLFTHFGCKEPLVLLEFRVSSPRRQLRVLNVPLTVLPSRHPLQGVLNGFQIKPVHNTNPDLSTGTQETAYNLTITFSPNVTTDLCLYSFELLPNTFPIPEHGQLLLPPNITRIPCGLEPLIPVKYTPRSASSKKSLSRDYALVRIWPRGAVAGLPLYGIVDIEFQQPSGGPAPLKTAHSILVHHSGYTPVPATHLLPSDFLTTDISKQMRIHVEATDCGVFVSHTTPINLADTATTLLTSPDLISESVAFHPIVNNCSANSSVNAFDISGRLLWSSSISIRVNILYNISTFDFVLDSSQTANVTSVLLDIFATFGKNCTVNLSRGPMQGNLHWTDPNVQFSTASLVPANFTSTLLYTSLNGGISDGFAFRTECSTDVSYITVFIMGLMKDPSQHSLPSVKIDVYLGYATQLGPHVLRMNYDQMDEDEPILVFLDNHDFSFYQILDPHTAETVLPLSTFHSTYNPVLSKKVTLGQWIDGRAWVVPLNVSGLGEVVRFALNVVCPKKPEIFVWLQASIHAQPPPTNKELFTPDVTITANHPLVLDVQSSPTQWTVISTLNLDVEAARRSVVYNVVIPPKFGSLCFYHQTCNHSLSTFTHEDLRSGTLGYYRTLPSKLDGFLFEIDGTLPQWFVIKLNNVIEDPCNVKPIFVPVMSNVSLTPFMFANQLDGVPLTNSTAFSVVVLPSQGYLSLQRGDTVTLSDLTSGKLNYEVVNLTSPAPIDSSVFVTVYNNTGYFSELVFVHLKNSTLPPYVHVRDLNTSTKSTELGNNFILTGFPFLVDIVHFVIVDEPIHGHIVHNHGQDSKTTVLSKNCSFSHASLKRGEIQYVISEGEDVNSFNDSLSIVLMLPSILPGFLPNKTYSLAIDYKKQALSQNKGLSVVSNLTVSLLNKTDAVYKYGVSLNGNIHIPEDMNATSLFISFRSRYGFGSFFMDSHERRGLIGKELQNSTLFYFLSQGTLKLMHTRDSIILRATYYPQNRTLHKTRSRQFTIDVFWSLVYFKKTSIEREVTNGGSNFSFYIKRRGTLVEETYITLNMTGITPGIALTCPNDRVGNDQRICVNESLTRIALHPDADQVEIFSTALVDKAVGGFEGNGQIEFQILGDQNAIPLPGNDTAVVRLNEFSIVRIEVDHYSGYGPSNECSKAITVNESSKVLSLQLVRSGNIRNKVGIVCYTKLPDGSFSGSFKERSRYADSSVVYFSENSSTALCNVTIMEEPHHDTVVFIVALAAKDGEHARPISSEESVCVYVVDRNVTRKEVFFDKTEYTFDEPDKSNFSYSLAIRRNWTSEKGDPTTTVFYRTTGGTATPWEDYIPIAGKAVHFRGPQQKYYISITLLVDQNDFEPNEYFYIEILNITDEHANSRTDRIKVIIQDDQVRIGFSQPVFTFQETEGKVRIYAKRSGNLVNSTNFLCIPAKIGSYRGEQPYKDVISFQEYLFTFQPGQNLTYCTVEINNDEVFDEVKLFEVTMYGVSAKVNRVRLGLRKAIVNITDEEDRQVVQFDPAVYSANRHIDMLEPATNCKVDEEVYVVRVTRTGDITVNTRVRVTSTGSLNYRFKLVDSEALFKRGQNVSKIRVDIKAYLNETDDNSFNLTLAPTSSDVQIPKVRIGEINWLIINIRNYQIKGPLFPAAPVIIGTDSSHPLTCVTPCDNITTYNDTCRYEEFCSTIDITATRYKWEESGDGVNFTKVKYLSWLVSTSSAMLDPAFLKPGYQYRCVVSPTSIAGNRGGTKQTRTSQPYTVSAGRECDASPRTTVTISPYREVGGSSDDRIVLAPSEVVKITISVQNINNTFPLVSMSMFHGDLLAAQNAPNSKHKCSNFLPGMHSLLGRQAFVDVPRITNLRTPTLNKCTWTFESWHLVKDLVDSCNARNSSNKTHGFDLNFYVSYFSGHHSKNIITDHVTKTVLLDQSLNPPPNPLEALVSTSSLNTVRLELLALKAGTRSHLEVVLRSTVIPADGSAQNLLLLPRPHIRSSSHLPSSLDLAASPKRNSNSSTQLWVLDDFSENIPNNYNVTFRCGPGSSYYSLQAFHFRLVENTRNPQGYQIAISTNFTIRTEGDYTIANLSVSPQSILRENVRLCLTGLTACHSWSKETVDGCMSSKISTIRNVLDLAGLALLPNTCSIASHSEYFSQSRLYTQIKFETRKLDIEDSWFFLANYTFVGDTSLVGQYYNKSSLKQIYYETPSTPGPTEGISMAVFVVPSVVTMVVTIVATVVVVCVVLCTYCRSRNKALEPVDCHATYQRSTRVIRTRVTPSGSEEYEMAQIITQKGVDPNLYIALALEGTRDKRRMLNNFRSLPQLPVIKEEPSTHDHRVVCTSTERSIADPSPVSNYTMDGEELADHVLEYLAISAPTPSVSRTRLHSDL